MQDPDQADDVLARLRRCGLRPTRQRVDLARLLFAQGNRHLTAEQLFAESRAAGIPVSLATVYNTLHQFTASGLLREVTVGPGRSYFDTNTGHHHHFFHEQTAALVDIEGPELHVAPLPEPPPGTKVARVDVVIRLRDA